MRIAVMAALLALAHATTGPAAAGNYQDGRQEGGSNHEGVGHGDPGHALIGWGERDRHAYPNAGVNGILGGILGVLQNMDSSSDDESASGPFGSQNGGTITGPGGTQGGGTRK